VAELVLLHRRPFQTLLREMRGATLHPNPPSHPPPARSGILQCNSTLYEWFDINQGGYWIFWGGSGAEGTLQEVRGKVCTRTQPHVSTFNLWCALAKCRCSLVRGEAFSVWRGAGREIRRAAATVEPLLRLNVQSLESPTRAQRVEVAAPCWGVKGLAGGVH
jgi:hypothetical protein